MRRKKCCMDCGTEIKRYNAKRCNSCAMKYKWQDPKLREAFIHKGSKNGKYNPKCHKTYYCLDCGVKISYKAKQNTGLCTSCSHKGERNINYKYGKSLGNHFCIDCGKEIKNWYAIRCKSCASRKLFLENNPAKRPEVREKMSKQRKGRTLSEDWKRKIRESCQGINQGNKNGMFGKTPKYKRIKYSNNWMRSGYEVNFAYFLDLSGIKWLYESKTFDLGNTTYTPDFYIPQWKLYIEIKGYWFEGSKKRFDLFKKSYPKVRIEVLDYPKLKQLGIVK